MDDGYYLVLSVDTVTKTSVKFVCGNAVVTMRAQMKKRIPKYQKPVTFSIQ